MAETVLVIAESALRTDDLRKALYEAGFLVVLVSPRELDLTADLPAESDVVLVSASLGLRRVALLSQRLKADQRRSEVVVFPQGDMEALDACVRGGFDYVAPPFRPSLLRARLLPSQQRRRLVAAVEAIAAEAKINAYERDLNVAHEVQTGFLPEELPAPPGWEFPFRFRPARTVAGDFYDGFELLNQNRLGFMVADVCDKGISAAMFMALIRTLLRNSAECFGTWNMVNEQLRTARNGGTDGVGPDPEPRQWPADGRGERPLSSPMLPTSMPILQRTLPSSLPPGLAIGAGPLLQSVVGTNRYLARHHLRQGYFVTLFFGVLDPETGALLFINGGHNPPVLVRRDGAQTLLRPTGPALGILADSIFSLGCVELEPGDTLFLYTDGVVEARAWTGEQFGMARLLDVLSTPAASAEATLAQVDSALAAHVGGAEQSDDITMLALRRLP